MIGGFLLDGGSDHLIKTKGDLIPSIRDFYLSSAINRRIESETPPLSPVCWTSFLTGKDPSGHSIFGFLERDFINDRFYIPNYSHITGQTLFDIFECNNIRFASINIPGTYPPKSYKKGIIISDFMSPSLDNAVNHKWLLPIIKSMDYRIDINPYECKRDKNTVLDQINSILDGRKRLLKWLSGIKTDIVLFHVMEFDRLCHYFYRDILDENSPYFISIINILNKIDGLFKDFLYYYEKKLENIFLLSDHGFREIKWEFYPNSLFYSKSLLNLDINRLSEESNDLPLIHPSRYFCLYPGRVYILQPETLKPDRSSAEKSVSDLKNVLQENHEGMDIIEDIIPCERLYENPGNISYSIYLKPAEGIDIKGTFKKNRIIGASDFQGMHDPADGIFASDIEMDIPAGDMMRISRVFEMICNIMVKKTMVYNTKSTAIKI